MFTASFAQTQNFCKDWAELSAGEYLYSNNVWGKGAITTGEQCLLTRSEGDELEYGWSWKWLTEEKENIKAYPEVIYGHKPWNRSSTTTQLPIQLSKLTTLQVNYSVITEATGDYNLTLNLWFTESIPPSPENLTHQLTIHLAGEYLSTTRDPMEKITIGNQSYTTYADQTDFGYHAFVSETGQTKAELELRAFLDYLIAQGKLSSTSYLAAIELGNNIASGEGITWLKNFEVIVGPLQLASESEALLGHTENKIPMSVWLVFLCALITALATGLGALPFFFLRKVSKRVLGLASAVAAGLMLTASFQLIHEGLGYNPLTLVLGVLLGLVMIVLGKRYLSNFNDINVGQLKGASAMQALLIVGVMTLHSFAEGIGVGVAYGDGLAFGLFITAAIAIHNIPEGIAISAVLVPKGVSVWRAGWWSIFSSLPQPLIAVPAFLFVEAFTPFLPVGLGLAAGAMIWMCCSEILPEALETAPKEQVATALTISVAIMTIFQVFIGG